MSENTQTLLVTGASGHLGRRVIELLLEANATRIIATTRTPARLADLAARGVEVRQADFDDPAGLVAAFADADRLLLISTDAVMVPGHRIAQHRAAIDAAAQAGVKHVVYTSLTRPEPGSPILIADDHYATEQALAASPLDWTVLRNNVYAEGFLRSLPRAIATGQLVAAGGDGGAGYVTREDCARAAAAALASAQTGRATLDITGPAVVTYHDLAQIVSQISNKPVSYVSISPDMLANGMVQAGLPPALAQMLASFDIGIAQGTLAVATAAVVELTGVVPQSVYDFLLAHRDELLAA
jgi:NAD(P)H dehydrogenase (quinone)